MKLLSRWPLILFGVLAIACLAFLIGRGGFSTGPVNAQVPTGWKAHSDPMGFSVALPPGWSARGDKATGRVELQSAAGETVIIWPIFVSAGRAGAALDAASATSVIRRLAARLWPDANWQPSPPPALAAVRLTGRRGANALVSTFTWINSPRGIAGFFYAVSAPADRYRSLEDTFGKILASFQVAGSPTGGERQRAVRYLRWADPREGAFSLEVPEGWNTTGGLFRFAAVDVRGALQSVSPDGLTRITIGDAEIPTFVVPNETLAWTGFTEGRWYSPGYGVNIMVRRYIPGPYFVGEYVQARIAPSCPGLQIVASRDRADAVQAINAINQQYSTPGFATQLTAGEVAFTCRGSADPANGYYFAGTQLTGGMGMAQWNVQYLFGYVTPAARVGETQSVLEHMMASFQVNPQWFGAQQQTTAATSQIVTRTNQEISNLISKSYWSTQSTLDELRRRRSNATLGLEDVVDTQSGQQFKIESGSNYYWIDHRGTIVGTDTYTRPSIDFREMVRLP